MAKTLEELKAAVAARKAAPPAPVAETPTATPPDGMSAEQFAALPPAVQKLALENQSAPINPPAEVAAGLVKSTEMSAEVTEGKPPTEVGPGKGRKAKAKPAAAPAPVIDLQPVVDAIKAIPATDLAPLLAAVNETNDRLGLLIEVLAK